MSTLENLVLELPEVLPAEKAEKVSTEGLAPAPKSRFAGLILESEAAANLGNPEVPTARYLLYSNTPMPQGDMVRLIGPRLEELGREVVPFAEVAVPHGEKVTAEIYYQFIQRHQRLLDQPGFMVKTMKDRIMVRVSPEAREKGFGQASATFLARVHEAFPEVEGIDLWWVTGNEDTVKRLGELADKAADTVTAIKSGVWKDRGFDYKSCQLAGHCGQCADKKMCSSVRQIEAKVRMKRRLDAKKAAGPSGAAAEAR